MANIESALTAGNIAQLKELYMTVYSDLDHLSRNFNFPANLSSNNYLGLRIEHLIESLRKQAEDHPELTKRKFKEYLNNTTNLRFITEVYRLHTTISYILNAFNSLFADDNFTITPLQLSSYLTELIELKELFYQHKLERLYYRLTSETLDYLQQVTFQLEGQNLFLDFAWYSEKVLRYYKGYEYLRHRGSARMVDFNVLSDLLDIFSHCEEMCSGHGALIIKKLYSTLRISISQITYHREVYQRDRHFSNSLHEIQSHAATFNKPISLTEEEKKLDEHINKLRIIYSEPVHPRHLLNLVEVVNWIHTCKQRNPIFLTKLKRLINSVYIKLIKYEFHPSFSAPLFQQHFIRLRYLVNILEQKFEYIIIEEDTLQNPYLVNLEIDSDDENLAG